MERKARGTLILTLSRVKAEQARRHSASLNNRSRGCSDLGHSLTDLATVQSTSTANILLTLFRP